MPFSRPPTHPRTLMSLLLIRNIKMALCPILHSYNIFSLLFYRNGPSSHYSGSSSRGQGSSALNSSWKSEAPLSPKPGSASNPNLGSSAADILSVKSSSLYLNNDDRRNAASPVSTSSSTSSKKFLNFPANYYG